MRVTVMIVGLLGFGMAAYGAQVGKPGTPMVVTAGNDVGWQVISPEEARKAFLERGELRGDVTGLQTHWAAQGELYGRHGVTAFEPYVKWMLMEPAEGTWDASFYDAELAAFQQAGLRWVPFLIAGPAYATPPWFKESDESVFAVDLTSGDVSRDQSIWNPHLRPRVKSWLQRFFQHYRAEDMQAVLLGISGVFGESIYTAGGNLWTHIWDGAYPQHTGWWCGDRYAVVDFRRAMRDTYETIGDLNRVWHADFTTFDDVVPFDPDKASSMRARLDMTRWYMGAMTDYAEWWVRTVRDISPDVPILLCTGGGAATQLGADMSAQAKMVAAYGAGMRITNEASDYGVNFLLTRHVGSACRQYGTYFGYEPAGAVDENGIVARVYNAVASGAWELFHYDNPPAGTRGERYLAGLPLLTVREPIVEVGVFWSRTAVDLGAARGLPEVCQGSRKLCDVALLDERMIADGALAPLRLLVWGSGLVTEADTAARIRRAVESGMALVVPAGWHPLSPEGDLIFPGEQIDPAPLTGRFSIPDMPSDAGKQGWRDGRFYGAEPDSQWHSASRVCWTAGDVAFHVPLPAVACRITVPYRIGNLPGPVTFSVAGEVLKTAAPGEVGDVAVDVAGTESGRVWTLRVAAPVWCPADVGESSDTRSLSVLFRDVIVEPLDGDGLVVGPVRKVHRFNRGVVVEASGSAPGDVSLALADVLRNPTAYAVTAPLADALLSTDVDQVYTTVTTQDILLYNHGDKARTVAAPTGPVTVPPHAIVSLPRP